MPSVLLKVAKAYMNNRIFAIDDPIHNRDNSLLPNFALREALNERRIDFNTTDLGNESDCEKIVIYDLYRENLEYAKYCIRQGWQKKLILVLWEGPVVFKRNWDTENHKLFDTILTWDDTFVDNKKYFKLYYPQPAVPYLGFTVPFSEKKLCTMIAGNKRYNHHQEICSERVKALEFFEQKAPGQFDLYGAKWDKPALLLHKVFPFLRPRYPSYRGTVAEKGKVLAKYKYAICYENTKNTMGYITEKIFDCFNGGCVPIYYGADNITDYVPADTFIDLREFASYQQLWDFLETIDEARYMQYMNAIFSYLHSDAYKRFSIDNFIIIMLPHLQ